MLYMKSSSQPQHKMNGAICLHFIVRKRLCSCELFPSKYDALLFHWNAYTPSNVRFNDIGSRYQIGNPTTSHLPSFCLIFSWNDSTESSGSHSTVIVFPVKVFTNTCIPMTKNSLTLHWKHSSTDIFTSSNMSCLLQEMFPFARFPATRPTRNNGIMLGRC